MPSARKKNASTASSLKRSSSHLRSIPGGKSAGRGVESISDLFSPSNVRAAKKEKRGRKQELPAIDFPKELEKYGDLFAAGRNILKELEFKVKFAEQRVRDFCNSSYIRVFASLKRKPPSLDFKGAHSSLKFVQTHRTTLTSEKMEELGDLGVPVENYTELVGIEINMPAVRQHKLEDKLQEGLAQMGVSKGVIEECFIPKHELNPTFYDNLYTIVQDSLKSGEDAEEKMTQVLSILEPSSQIRNVETKLSEQKAFELLRETEIEADEGDLD